MKIFSDEQLEKEILAGAITAYHPDIYTINPEDFTNADYRRIYDVMRKIQNDGLTVNFPTVYAEIAKTDEQFARSQVTALSSERIMSFHIPALVDSLKELGKKRRLSDALVKAQAMITDGREIGEVMTVTSNAITEIASAGKIKGSMYGEGGIGAERFRLNLRPTGLSFLDDIIGGFMPGQLIIIAARPAKGKSALGIEIAESVARRGTVAFVSLEMENIENELRRAARASKIEMDVIVSGKMNEGQLKKFNSAEMQLIKDRNLIMIDGAYEIESIKNEIRKIALKMPLELVVVDYLQIIACNIKKDRHLQIGDITRSLKLLAKELKTPIILISQLNRAADGEEPQLSNLRDSGAIEQDANIVIFLHQDEEDKLMDRVDLIIAKNRQGKTGKRKIYFKKPILKFYEEAPYDEPYADPREQRYAGSRSSI